MPSSQPTRSVPIGRYALEVGGSAGTVIATAPVVVDGTAVQVPAELAAPLAKDDGGTIGQRFERATLAADEATSRLKKAEDLWESVLDGSALDGDHVLGYAGDLLNVLDSLDKADRWEEWLRYARAIHRLLALAKEWVALVRSLRTMLRAAERAPELEAAVGWAQHELGTLHLAVEDSAAAQRRLEAAREIRQRLRDGDGLAVTEQSLSVLCRQQARAGQTRRGRGRRRLLVAATAVLLLLLIGGVAGAVIDPFSTEDDQGAATSSGGVPVTVTVRMRGDGDGRVTSGSGIDCPGECEVSVERGSRIRLRAIAVGDAVFAGWRRGCEGLGRCALTVVGPVTIIARFTAKAADEPTLTVEKSGDGGGTVTSDVPGVDCGATCVAPFPFGNTVVLTQTADEGSTFSGWSGAGCSGTGGCSVTLDGSKKVTATFGLEPTPDVTLTTGVVGSGSISATTGSDSEGRDCTQGCTYPKDTPVTITATLGRGANNVTWDGCDSATGTSCAVKMSADRKVSARFSFAEP
jgi:hypothetical protein